MITVLEQVIAAGVMPEKTYLADGTAVYLYLQHRYSIDLDFFSPQPFRPEIILKWLESIFPPITVDILEKDTVIAHLTEDKVKYSLFHFPFPIIEPVQVMELSDAIRCPLASLIDLEMMKSVAIVQRGSAKDFIDLFYLLKKSHHTLDDLLEGVNEKYGLQPSFEYQLRTALVYFDDADREVKDILMLSAAGTVEPISKTFWDEIRAFFKGIAL